VLALRNSTRRVVGARKVVDDRRDFVERGARARIDRDRELRLAFACEIGGEFRQGKRGGRFVDASK